MEDQFSERGKEEERREKENKKFTSDAFFLLGLFVKTETLDRS